MSLLNSWNKNLDNSGETPTAQEKWIEFVICFHFKIFSKKQLMKHYNALQIKTIGRNCIL